MTLYEKRIKTALEEIISCTGGRVVLGDMLERFERIKDAASSALMYLPDENTKSKDS